MLSVPNAKRSILPKFQPQDSLLLLLVLSAFALHFVALHALAISPCIFHLVPPAASSFAKQLCCARSQMCTWTKMFQISNPFCLSVCVVWVGDRAGIDIPILSVLLQYSGTKRKRLDIVTAGSDGRVILWHPGGRRWDRLTRFSLDRNTTPLGGPYAPFKATSKATSIRSRPSIFIGSGLDMLGETGMGSTRMGLNLDAAASAAGALTDAIRSMKADGPLPMGPPQRGSGSRLHLIKDSGIGIGNASSSSSGDVVKGLSNFKPLEAVQCHPTLPVVVLAESCDVRFLDPDFPGPLNGSKHGSRLFCKLDGEPITGHPRLQSLPDPCYSSSLVLFDKACKAGQAARCKMLVAYAWVKQLLKEYPGIQFTKFKDPSASASESESVSASASGGSGSVSESKSGGGSGGSSGRRRPRESKTNKASGGGSSSSSSSSNSNDAAFVSALDVKNAVEWFVKDPAKQEQLLRDLNREWAKPWSGAGHDPTQLVKWDGVKVSPACRCAKLEVGDPCFRCDQCGFIWCPACKEVNWSGHVMAVRDVAIAPNGQRMATVSADGTCLVWDISKFVPLDPEDRHRPCQHPRKDDPTKCDGGCNGQCEVLLSEYLQLKEKYPMLSLTHPDQNESLEMVSFSPDAAGSRIVVACPGAGNSVVWNVHENFVSYSEGSSSSAAAAAAAGPMPPQPARPGIKKQQSGSVAQLVFPNNKNCVLQGGAAASFLDHDYVLTSQVNMLYLYRIREDHAGGLSKSNVAKRRFVKEFISVMTVCPVPYKPVALVGHISGHLSLWNLGGTTKTIEAIEWSNYTVHAGVRTSVTDEEGDKAEGSSSGSNRNWSRSQSGFAKRGTGTSESKLTSPLAAAGRKESSTLDPKLAEAQVRGVTALAFSPSGHNFVTAGKDCSLYVYSLRILGAKEQIRRAGVSNVRVAQLFAAPRQHGPLADRFRFHGHLAPILSVDFDKTGAEVFSADAAGHAMRWFWKADPHQDYVEFSLASNLCDLVQINDDDPLVQPKPPTPKNNGSFNGTESLQGFSRQTGSSSGSSGSSSSSPASLSRGDSNAAQRADQRKLLMEQRKREEEAELEQQKLDRKLDLLLACRRDSPELIEAVERFLRLFSNDRINVRCSCSCVCVGEVVVLCLFVCVCVSVGFGFAQSPHANSTCHRLFSCSSGVKSSQVKKRTLGGVLLSASPLCSIFATAAVGCCCCCCC